MPEEHPANRYHTESQISKERLRQHSQYKRSRFWISFLAVIIGAAILIQFFSTMKQVNEMSEFLLLLVKHAVQLLVLILGHNVLQAIFDAADLGFRTWKASMRTQRRD